MRYFSLFSGIGGFELGIQNAYVETINRIKNSQSESHTPEDVEAGKRLESAKGKDASPPSGQSSKLLNRLIDQGAPACMGYSEIDPYAIKIYQKHFPHHVNYGDITTIKEDHLADFDILIGGFPCQTFSIAGLRRGFDDTRGTLFFDIARILHKKQPRLFLLENVKGLLSHDGGRTFKTIITTLTELGYDLQWQVLNSKDFGVPQNRERVYIVGSLRGTTRPKVFPITASNGNHIKEVTRAVPQAQRVYDESGISPTIDIGAGGNRQPKIIQRGRGKNKGGEKELSPTLSTNVWPHNNPVYDGVRLRRLTPVECERLQSFPDGWTADVSDTQRYKTIGNAVTTNVIKHIMISIFNGTEI